MPISITINHNEENNSKKLDLFPTVSKETRKYKVCSSIQAILKAINNDSKLFLQSVKLLAGKGQIIGSKIERQSKKILTKTLKYHYCNNNRADLTFHCVNLEIKRQIFLSILVSYINLNLDYLNLDILLNVIKNVCAIHLISENDILKHLKSVFESVYYNGDIFDFLLRFQNDEILVKKYEIIKCLGEYEYITKRSLTMDKKNLSILIILYFCQKNNILIKNKVFFEIVFEKRFSVIQNICDDLTNQMNKTSKLIKKINNFEKSPSDAEIKPKNTKVKPEITPEIARTNSNSVITPKNNAKTICTCLFDNFCLCARARDKLDLPRFISMDIPWDINKKSESKSIQNTNNETFMTYWNPCGGINVKKSKEIVFNKVEKCETKLHKGLVFDKKCDHFGFPMRKIKCDNQHGLNYKKICKHFLFPEFINWGDLHFKNKNGQFSYFHHFQPKDDFYGLFENFTLHWLEITELKFEFCYSDSNGNRYFYKGAHFLNSGNNKLVTVQKGDLFNLNSDKIYYSCRFPYQVKKTFGGYDIKTHENFISREVEEIKCVICSKILNTIDSKYFHFFRHFTKSRFFAKKINSNDFKKYACAKFETIGPGGAKYKGYPIALIKINENHDKLTILNQTGIFKLILNNFLVNFTTKTIYLNYKNCTYKISEINDKELSFESVTTYQMLFNVFAKKVFNDTPYFQPIKKTKSLLTKSEITEKIIYQNDQYIPAQRSIKLKPRIKLIPIRALENIEVREIPEILSYHCENSIINSATASSQSIRDKKSAIEKKQYFRNSKGNIKIDYQLSLLNYSHSDLKFHQRMEKIRKKNQKNLFPIISNEYLKF